jgi:hypothetical protein
MIHIDISYTQVPSPLVSPFSRRVTLQSSCHPSVVVSPFSRRVTLQSSCHPSVVVSPFTPIWQWWSTSTLLYPHRHLLHASAKFSRVTLHSHLTDTLSTLTGWLYYNTMMMTSLDDFHSLMTLLKHSDFTQLHDFTQRLDFIKAALTLNYMTTLSTTWLSTNYINQLTLH